MKSGRVRRLVERAFNDSNLRLMVMLIVFLRGSSARKTITDRGPQCTSINIVIIIYNVDNIDYNVLNNLHVACVRNDWPVLLVG